VKPFEEPIQSFSSTEYESDEAELQPLLPKYVLLKNSSLLISEVGADDVGDYKCIVIWSLYNEQESLYFNFQ